jgi:hypothetical protein
MRAFSSSRASTRRPGSAAQSWRGPDRRIVIKTGKPPADSRARPELKPGRQCTLTDRKTADCHRSSFSPPLLRP